MVIPAGWVETTSKSSEVQIIQLTAPAIYLDAPTTLTVDSYIGIVASTVTAHQVASQDEQRESSADSTFTAGQITDCQVQSDNAAYFSFTRGAETGYHLFLIHNQLVYDALLQGYGGLSASSVLDTKAAFGSWTWQA